jgi:hypothetical protein
MGAILYLLFKLEEVDPQVFQYPGADALPLPDKPEQEVFGTDVIMAQPESFLSAQPDDVLHSIGKISFHYDPCIE